MFHCHVRLAAAAAVVGALAGAGTVVAGQGARRATPAPSQAARQISMPPMPTPGYQPARPLEMTRQVYEFAARHPEVLTFVPCYCGCEATGHPHNESCFVARRDAQGNVTEWDVHGYG
ncbi:MAG: PCYCGC motif-containing (lipo)protein [Acidobacteriota bacterium]